MRTGPNADPATGSGSGGTSEGGIFGGGGGGGGTVPPSLSLGGRGGVDDDRAHEGEVDRRQSRSRGGSGSGGSAHAAGSGKEREDDEDVAAAAAAAPGRPGHSRAWFSLPADGVLDSFLLIQYLRSVLCADGLMKVLHCATEQQQQQQQQQQRPAGSQSPPPPPPPSLSQLHSSPELDKQPRRLPQLSQPPPLDVSFKGRGHRRRLTDNSPLARAYSQGGGGGPGSASGASSTGGRRRGNRGGAGEHTSAAAAAVVEAAVGEAMLLAGTSAGPRRHSGGGGRAGQHSSPGRAGTAACSGNDADVTGVSLRSMRGSSTDEGESDRSSCSAATAAGTTVLVKAPEARPSKEVRLFAAAAAAAAAKAMEKEGKDSAAAAAAAAGKEGGEDKDATNARRGERDEEGGSSGGGGGGGGGETSGGVSPGGGLIEEAIDPLDLSFVYSNSSWQPAGVHRSDPAAKRTATAAREVCVCVHFISICRAIQLTD